MIFMSEVFLTIQEAAEISGKSIQTIRRALKSTKLEGKRKKTPQGFNYMISRESLAQLYKLQASMFDREKGGLQEHRKTTSQEPSVYATLEDLKKMQHEISDVLQDYQKEKENFMRFMKGFQEKVVVLENQLKLIEQPKKSWYQFWK